MRTCTFDPEARSSTPCNPTRIPTSTSFMLTALHGRAAARLPSNMKRKMDNITTAITPVHNSFAFCHLPRCLYWGATHSVNDCSCKPSSLVGRRQAKQHPHNNSSRLLAATVASFFGPGKAKAHSYHIRVYAPRADHIQLDSPTWLVPHAANVATARTSRHVKASIL
jgi:hypothetical protein